MEGTVTSLERQKRRRRVNVYLDGEYAFSLEEIGAAALYLGQKLTAEEVRQLQMRDGVNRAQERALSLLEVRPRSRAELELRLRQAKHEDEAIAEALERLERVELVDDAAFTAYWVEQRQAFSPRSRRALQYELRRQGVPVAIVQRALAEWDEEGAAWAALEREAKRLGPDVEPDEARARLKRRLQSRGFGYRTILEAIRRWEISERFEPDASPDDGLDFTQEDEHTP